MKIHFKLNKQHTSTNGVFTIQINIIYEISINISSLADRRETGDLDTLFYFS